MHRTGDDHLLVLQHLFENIHPIPLGVSYNCYVLEDEKTALFDTVDWSACRQMLENIKYVLKGRDLDYLVINHLEPNHAACIEEILLIWPNVKLISTEKGFMLARQFGFDVVTLDLTDGVLFSADAFGSFIANDGKLFADEVNFERDYLDEARRYLVNIVGKYGPHVQFLLGKAAPVLDKIKIIAPLHGILWRTDLMWFIDKYDHWSKYIPEEKGVLIVYASMYGNTESAAQALASRIVEKGVTNVKVCDVSNTHVSYLISDSFKYSHIVLASVTYNLNIYPVMHDYLDEMRMLNLQNRTILNERVTFASSLKPDKEAELENMAQAIVDQCKRKWEQLKKHTFFGKCVF